MMDTRESRVAPGQEISSARMAESAAARLTPSQVRWHYEDGFLLQALQRVGEETENRSLLGFVRSCVDSLVAPDGAIPSYRMEDFNLDMVRPGTIVLHLFRRTGDERFRKAAALLRDQLRKQPRCPSGGFWHKKIYPDQMWLDGLFMAEPFYAAYASLFKEPDPFADVAHQFILMEERSRDTKTGLLSHAWDEGRRQLWANPETGRSPCFWSRAMGWYAMALVDTLELMPRANAERAPLLTILGRLLPAVARHQDPATGLWFQVTDQVKRAGNYPEASASCMFVYAILKAGRLGFLKNDALRLSALRGFDAVMARFVTVEKDGSLGLEGTCGSAGLGGNPYRDGSYAYYIGEPRVKNDHKGVAAFILAARERELDA